MEQHVHYHLWRVSDMSQAYLILGIGALLVGAIIASAIAATIKTVRSRRQVTTTQPVSPQPEAATTQLFTPTGAPTMDEWTEGTEEMHGQPPTAPDDELRTLTSDEVARIRRIARLTSSARTDSDFAAHNSDDADTAATPPASSEQDWRPAVESGGPTLYIPEKPHQALADSAPSRQADPLFDPLDFPGNDHPTMYLPIFDRLWQEHGGNHTGQ